MPRAVAVLTRPLASPETGVQEFKLRERSNTNAQRGTMFLNFIQIKVLIGSATTW